MTQKTVRASKAMNSGGQQTGEPDIGVLSAERMRAANEVGSAIVHQLNGPLTALRLYVGEIRQHTNASGGCGFCADRLTDILATSADAAPAPMLQAAE